MDKYATFHPIPALKSWDDNFSLHLRATLTNRVVIWVCLKMLG